VRKILLILGFIFTAGSLHSQVLISLLFGDKLNSGNVEFGLDGGLTMSTIQGFDGAKFKNGFNLGFYFDIKLKKNPAWMINTGVLVKSPMGTRDLAVYATGDDNLDEAFEGGKRSINLGYFNVPIMMKYQFRNHIYVKAGAQLGLMNKASDEFTQSVDDGDLEYTIKNRDNYHPIDAGAAVGIGYRLMGGNGMNIGLQYYQGLIDISVDDQGPNQYNSAFYANVGIPIGKGKAQKKQQEKAK
jgi:Outer membrane protein beta-barrel domain